MDYSKMTGTELTDLIRTSLDGVRDWEELKLSLDGGEGLQGPATRRALCSTAAADYYPGERIHPSSAAFDVIELMAMDCAKEIYNCKYVDLHTLSSGSASTVVMCALAGEGETIMSFPDPLGHRSMRHEGMGRDLNRKYVDIPVDEKNLCIDMEAFEKVVMEEKPKLIMLGSALYLRLEPYREIREIADRVGALVSVDVSHTYGEIACSMSVNPLNEGMDLLLGSTYKTVCGPNKGMICTNSAEINEKIRERAAVHVSNYNSSLIPALTQALVDLRDNREVYGCQLIKNAKALAAEMEKVGFEMMCKDYGYTETHLVAAKMKGTDKKTVIKKLDSANILCSCVPCDDSHYYLRPATLVLTRRGFVESDMAVIAKLLADVVFEDKIDEVKAKVAEIMADPIHHVVHFAQQ